MDPRLVSAIQEILIGILQILAVIVATYVAKWVKTHASQRQMDLAVDIAQLAVSAVEQLAASGQIDLNEKYAKAVMLARNQAAKVGLEFSDDQWQGLIEAAVAAMKAAGEEIVGAPAT